MTEAIKHISKPDCIICGKECFLAGISIPMVAVTESGQIEDAYTNKEQSQNIVIPLCPYHMVIAGEGFICSDGKSLIINPDIDTIGKLPTEFIQQTLKKIKVDRSVPNKIRKYNVHVGETVLSARKFELEMSKSIDKLKMEMENNG
jgi:hypothetical protein